MTRFRAVIFDLDDTLYPEQQYVFSGFRAVAEWLEARFGCDAEETANELREISQSGSRGTTFDAWLLRHGRDPKDVLEMVAVYRGHQPDIRPFPEVPHLLQTLRAEYKLGLLSDGYLAVQRLKLEALGLSPYLDAVMFTDELGRDAWKPSPVAFVVLLEKLRVSPAHAVYVADNPAKDFIAARRAGVSTVYLCRGTGVYAAVSPESPEHEADTTIPDLSQLAASLSWLEGRFFRQ